MEYAQNICNDQNYIRYVGYSENTGPINDYFSHNTINTISKKVTQLTYGVIQNKPIIVPDHIIADVMNQIYISYRPMTGDIYSRYIVPSGQTTDDYITSMIDQTIEVIVSDIKNSIGIDQQNTKLSIWSSLYGEFNPEGLRQHAPIKIRHKKPTSMQFNMNY